MLAPGSSIRKALPSFLAFFLAVSGWLLPAQAQAQGRRGSEVPSLRPVFRDVVASPSESTVRIRCSGKDAALGTVVGADGWILTKNSELTTPVICVLKDGRQLPARILGVHEPYDLALLKVEAKDLKPVQWADIKSAVPGNFVATPGTGRDPVAVGVVSVASRKVTARDLPPIQNNSGFLGIALEDAAKGVKISAVTPGSAAARAGFKVGDVVVAVAGKEVNEPNNLINAIQHFKVGDEVAIKIRRGDDELELKPILGKRQGSERADFQNRLGNEMSNRRGGFPSILQHDTVLRPSECGGPLVDLDGKAVGINIARAGRVETYAVPADVVLALLPEMKAGKFPSAELKEAEDQVKTAKTALAKAEKALKEVETRLKEAKAPEEKLETEHKDAQKRLKDAQKALEKAQNELKAWK
jgi:serine protease Do